MELANNTLTAWFAMLRIIIIRVCVKIFIMARFLNPYLCAIWHKDKYLFFDLLSYKVCLGLFSMEMLERRA